VPNLPFQTEILADDRFVLVYIEACFELLEFSASVLYFLQQPDYIKGIESDSESEDGENEFQVHFLS
jgi:hypothetical protein